MVADPADRLERIFDRSNGRCHICWGALVFKNYASFGDRGAWEIEHSNPRSKGGSERLCNLYAAHIFCNREKGTMHTRTARKWNGQTRAPRSRSKKQQIREENTLAVAGIGALFGVAIGGPLGLLIGGLIGAGVGNELDAG